MLLDIENPNVKYPFIIPDALLHSVYVTSLKAIKDVRISLVLKKSLCIKQFKIYLSALKTTSITFQCSILRTDSQQIKFNIVYDFNKNYFIETESDLYTIDTLNSYIECDLSAITESVTNIQNVELLNECVLIVPAGVSLTIKSQPPSILGAYNQLQESIILDTKASKVKDLIIQIQNGYNCSIQKNENTILINSIQGAGKGRHTGYKVWKDYPYKQEIDTEQSLNKRYQGIFSLNGYYGDLIIDTIGDSISIKTAYDTENEGNEKQIIMEFS